MPSHIKTRILIISDTHSALPIPSQDSYSTSTQPSSPPPQHPFHYPLPKADILLHAGDLTITGSVDQHRKALDLIHSIDAELKIIIPGNHDLTLDREWYARNPGRHTRENYSEDVLREIEEMYTSDEAREKGVRYLVEGTETYTLSTGATFTVYASAYQPEFFNWAFGYPRDHDRYNPPCPSPSSPTTFQPPNPIPDSGVDIMLTHGPPATILDRTSRGEDVGCVHLRRAVERCKPKIHAFGHIHEAWGAVRKSWVDGIETDVEVPKRRDVVEEMGVLVDATDIRYGEETLFVNASIMDLRYKPVQAPWVVDVLLPCEGEQDGGGVEEVVGKGAML